MMLYIELDCFRTQVFLQVFLGQNSPSLPLHIPHILKVIFTFITKANIFQLLNRSSVKLILFGVWLPSEVIVHGPNV